MADQQQRARVGLQHALQQVDGFEVEVVGGFVQHQQVGRAGEQPGQQQAVALATRQGTHGGTGAVGREQEVLQIADDVATIAVDLDVIGTGADGVGHGAFGIELFAQLVEIGNLQVAAQANAARVGRVFAEDQLEQRGLADAVGADQADAVTAHDGEIEVAHQTLAPQADAGLAGFADQLAGPFAGIHFQSDLAGALAAGCPGLAQGFETADAPFVAGAAGFDALADPDFFLCPELVELAVGDGLGFELFAAHAFVGGEVAGEAAQQATIQFDDAGGHLVEKAPVVGDDDGGRPRIDDGFQRLDGLDVEVVGGLVEQQQVGLQGERQGQGGALVLAAGQAIGAGVRIDTEAVHFGAQAGLQRPVAALVVFVDEAGGSAPGDQAVEQRGRWREGRLLFDQDDAQAVADDGAAIVELHAAGDDVEQTGLAGAVAADQPQPFTGGEGEGRTIEQRMGTERQASVDQAEQDTHRKFRKNRRGNRGAGIRPMPARKRPSVMRTHAITACPGHAPMEDARPGTRQGCRRPRGPSGEPMEDARFFGTQSGQQAQTFSNCVSSFSRAAAGCGPPATPLRHR